MKKQAMRGTGDQKPDDPDQSRRFAEAASKVEASDAKKFIRAMKVIAPKKRIQPPSK